MKKSILLTKILVAFLLFSCSDDDGEKQVGQFVVAFENPSLSFTAEENSKEIKLAFSKAAPEDGVVTVSYTTENADYGTHFNTDPSGESGTIEVPITSGSTAASFTFTKLQNPIEGTQMNVNLKLDAVSNPGSAVQGNTTQAVSFTDAAATGGVLAAEVGGPNQPNQVYVDLSSQNQMVIKRDSWDLGFYSGDQFRVVLNGSLYMAVAALESTDIDAITQEDIDAIQSTVAVGNHGPSGAESAGYVDSPEGLISGTAIAAVSEADADNQVYLLNLGYEIGTETPQTGSVDITDDVRGWKKIRILRDGDTYVLQYANIDDTTHKEMVISKSEGFNFTFFSFDTEAQVNVEPQAQKWDLNFTSFTNVIPISQTEMGAYGYADYITTNLKSGALAYQVSTEDVAYEDFTADQVNEENFIEDQRGIGSGWRNGGGPSSLPSLKGDVFFVLKDPEGNLYKIRFTALLSESGERGYPSFEYSLL